MGSSVVYTLHVAGLSRRGKEMDGRWPRWGARKESWLTCIKKDPFERERGVGRREGKTWRVHSSSGFPCTTVLCQSAAALVLGSQDSACKGAEPGGGNKVNLPTRRGRLRWDAGAL